jgi:hypothetical protein
MPDAPAPLVGRAVELLSTAERAATAYGREDLAQRLAAASDRLGQPDLHALVVGEFKQGKSTLVNALLNVPLCPVSDELATVVPTIVRHGAEASAEVIAEAPAGSPQPLDPTARQPIPLNEIPKWASEQGNEDNSRSIRAVEIRVPRQLLSSGLALVDTPGVGGLHSVHGAATMAVLGTAQVVIFVSDASQELSGTELGVLRTAAARCPTVVCVLTKIDLYPAWRRIADLNRGHLDAAGLSHVKVLPVSSLLRQEALATQSKEVNEESGYPALLRFLNESVIARAQHVAVRTAVSTVIFALDQLDGTFGAEKAVLVDPERARPVVQDLEKAQDRAERLRAQSARWQQTLSDGSQDLASEIDHDLRYRFRMLNNAADEALDGNDPMDIWDDFSAWFRQEAAAAVAANAEQLREEANALAARVAEHFAIDETAVVHAVDVGQTPLIESGLDVSFERAAKGAGLLAAMRGSYGGILMFGMMGQLAGLTLVNPLTAVIGIGLGRRALKDERKRQLTMRRQQSKQSSKRYLDEIAFTANKVSRDAIRHVQRDLRDEFTARAEQLQRSTREALAAAEAAARQTAQEAASRVKDIDAELKRIASLRQTADQLAAACAETAP